MLLQQLPAVSACDPCTLNDTVSFCARIIVPGNFSAEPGVTSDVCVAVQTNDLSCSSTACEQSLTGITLPNPCDPLSFLSCSGTVTLYKLHLGGSVSVIVNLPVTSTKPGDVTSCPASLQLSRQLCVPIDNDVCIGCSPVDCASITVPFVTAVVVTSLGVVIAGDTTTACTESVWEVRGDIVLNSSLCAGTPPPAPGSIVTSYSCEQFFRKYGGLTIKLQETGQQFTNVSTIQNVVFANLPPGTYHILIQTPFGLLVESIPVVVVSGTQTDANNQLIFCPFRYDVTVSCDNGGSVAGFTVVLRDSSSTIVDQQVLVTNSTSLFAVTPGLYTIEVYNASMLLVSVYGPFDTADQVRSIPLIVPCVLVSGSISGSACAPPVTDYSGYTAFIVDSGNDILAGPVSVQANGEYVIDSSGLLSGTYVLVIEDSLGNPVAFESFSVVNGVSTDLGTISIVCPGVVQPGTLSGCVCVDGAAFVRLYSMANVLLQTVPVTSDPSCPDLQLRYDMVGVAPGLYTLQVWDSMLSMSLFSEGIITTGAAIVSPGC
jgi:hypothetical protein